MAVDSSSQQSQGSGNPPPGPGFRTNIPQSAVIPNQSIAGITVDKNAEFQQKLLSRLEELTEYQSQLLIRLDKSNKDILNQFKTTDKNISGTIQKTSAQIIQAQKSSSQKEDPYKKTIELVNEQIQKAENATNKQRQLVDALLKRDEVQSKINKQSMYMTGLLAGDVKSVTKSLFSSIKTNVEAQKEYRAQLEKNRQILRNIDEEIGYEEANADVFDAIGNFLPIFKKQTSAMADKFRVKADVMREEKSQIQELMDLQAQKAKATGEDTKLAFDELFRMLAQNQIYFGPIPPNMLQAASQPPSAPLNTLQTVAQPIQGPSILQGGAPGVEELSSIANQILQSQSQSATGPANTVISESKELVVAGTGGQPAGPSKEIVLADVFSGEKKTPTSPKESDIAKLAPEFGLAPLFLGKKLDELVKLNKEATKKLAGKLDDLADAEEDSGGGLFGMIGQGLGKMLEGLKNLGDNIHQFLANAGKGLKEFLTEVGKGLENLGKKKEEKDKGIKILIQLAAILVGTLFAMSFIKGMDIGVLIGAFVFGKVMESLGETLKKLSKIKDDELRRGRNAMISLAAILLIGTFALSLIKGMDMGVLMGVAVFTGAMYVLGEVMKKMAKIKEDEAKRGLLITGGLALILLVGTFALSLIKGIDMSVLMGVAIFAGAIWILGETMKGLSKIKMNELIMGGIAMVAIAAVLLIGTFALSLLKGIDPMVAVLVGVFTLSVIGLAVTAALIGTVAMTPVFWMGLLAIGAVMTVLVGGVYLLAQVGKSVDPKSAEGIKLIAESLLAFANPLFLLLPITAVGIGALGAALVVFSAGYFIAGGVAKLMGTELIENLVLFGQIPAGNLLSTAAGITALGAALAAFGAGSLGGGVLSAIGNFFGGDPVEKFRKFAEIADPLEKAANAVEKLVAALERMGKVNMDDLGSKIERLGRSFEISMIPKILSQMIGIGTSNFALNTPPTQTVEDLYIAEDGTRIEKSPEDKLLFIQDLNTVKVVSKLEMEAYEKSIRTGESIIDAESQKEQNDKIIELLSKILNTLNKMAPDAFPKEKPMGFSVTQNPLRFST